MPSTFERSFVKGVVWEVFSFILTLIAVLLVYGNLALSIKFSLALTLVKICFFFFNERIWKTIKWGKIEYKK